MPPTQYEVALMAGGLDQVTPTLSLKPGVAREAVNFEAAITGGYTRIKGYERFDGRAAPSDATYEQLYVTAFVNTPAVGDTITGQTSAATGVVAAVTLTCAVVTRVVGTFVVGEVIKVGATTLGTITELGGILTSKVSAQYLNAAADVYRTLITTVPGSGSILGVVLLNDVLYAFRNNAGGTAAAIYKSSTSGWTAVTLYNEVSFTVGAGSLADGQVLTQGANTATIKRVVITSGSLAAGTAAGRLIVTTPAPGALAAGAATTSGGGTLTLSGAQTAITLTAGGRYEFDITNFAGSAATIRIYGCSGVQRGFEFDGDVYVPITTGATSDTPKHVAAFKNHLIFAIGSSLVHSAPALPYDFQVIDGAGEIAVGDTITGLLVQSGSQSAGALVTFTRNNTSMLYGTSALDWNLISQGLGVGAVRYSAQNMAQGMFLDDRGVMTLATSQNFGNFESGTLTSAIQSTINAKRNLVLASTVSREKSQYRLFFSDGTGLYLTMVNGKYLGVMPVAFNTVVNCTWNGELNSGDEVTYFGGTDGFVYQMEKGTSFDGADISASLVLNYNSIKSPRLRKRYRHAALEVTGMAYAAISFGYLLGYSSLLLGQSAPQEYESGFSPMVWDSFVWDAFTWDGYSLAPTEAELRGTAENIALTFSSGTDYIDSYTLNSATLHYSVRRGLR